MIRQAIARLLGVDRRSYTGDVIAMGLARASGSTPSSEVAAVAAAAGLWGRSLSRATVHGTGVLGPAVLQQIGTSLAVRGEWVAAIDVARDGRVSLTPAGYWTITGNGPDPSGWTYTLDICGPSGQTQRTVNGDGVIHVKYDCPASQPWRGRSPLRSAGLSASLMSSIELQLSREFGAAHGFLLPVPRDDDSLNDVRTGMADAKGKTLTIESAATGFGDATAKVSQDWQPRRFGADPPDSTIKLRKDAAADILSCYGVPIELVTTADGTGMRESYRRFTLTTISPLGEIIGEELTIKLETNIVLSFETLRGSDVQGAARAVAALVKAEIDKERALKIVGLIEQET